VQVNPFGDQQRAEPVPPAGGFDDRVMGSGELGDVVPQGRGIVGEGGVPHAFPRGPEGGHAGAEPMLIDAGVENGRSTRGPRSLTTIPLGNIRAIELTGWAAVAAL